MLSFLTSFQRCILSAPVPIISGGPNNLVARPSISTGCRRSALVERKIEQDRVGKVIYQIRIWGTDNIDRDRSMKVRGALSWSSNFFIRPLDGSLAIEEER